MSGGRIALCLLLLCAPLAAQAPDFAELWREGSLWQVGDNRNKVDAARKAIVDAGDPGLQYALTRLAASESLEIRCLHEVIAGFGPKAVGPLTEHISHNDAMARRNVAELLALIDGRNASAALLVQAGKEDSAPAKLAQLAALSKWKVREALQLVLEASRGGTQRGRLRVVGMLAEFDDASAGQRLIEMLEDNTYYVRAAAGEALKSGAASARMSCLDKLAEVLAEQNAPRLAQRLLPIVASLDDSRVPALLQSAVTHERAAIRGAAAAALAAWKRRGGASDTLNVDSVLHLAWKTETDPYARTEIESARKQLKDK